MPFLLSVKILHSSHSNVFSWRMYAFLDNTSLFSSCSFIDAVFADLSYAKLLVCCADSLFGLDVRRQRCVVLSSLQVPPHFFTQKSALATSGIRNVAMTFFFGFFWHVFGLTRRRHMTCSLSLRLDPTGREFPSPLITVFDTPTARV